MRRERRWSRGHPELDLMEVKCEKVHWRSKQGWVRWAAGCKVWNFAVRDWLELSVWES